MMKHFICKYKRKDYLIDFYYYHNRVMCRVYVNYKFLAEGIALFNLNDDPKTYSAYYGEKLSLTRAIKLFSKNLRTSIWNAYKGV